MGISPVTWHLVGKGFRFKSRKWGMARRVHFVGNHSSQFRIAHVTGKTLLRSDNGVFHDRESKGLAVCLAHFSEGRFVVQPDPMFGGSMTGLTGNMLCMFVQVVIDELAFDVRFVCVAVLA